MNVPFGGLGSVLAMVAVAMWSSSTRAQQDARTPVDAVAAVVERRVITVREVEAEARLVLLDRAGAQTASQHLESSLKSAVLDSMVAQELLALEARRTGVAVREIDIDKSVASVRARFADADESRAFLGRFGIDEELLRNRARRDLAAAALLSKTFADVKTTDEEADAFLSEHADLVDRQNARAVLEKQKRDAKFQALMHRLKNEIEVRVVWRADSGAP